MFNYYIVLVALIVATYTDIKYRIISNYLTLGLIAFGVFYNSYLLLNNINLLLLYLVLTLGFYIACYILWYLGIFAGGDAKLFVGIFASIPFFSFHTFGVSSPDFFFTISLLIISIFVIFPYGAILTMSLFFKTKQNYGLFKTELLKKSVSILESIIIVISVIILLDYFKLSYLFSIPVVVLLNYINNRYLFYLSILLFAFAMFTNPIYWIYYGIIAGLLSYLLWFIIKIYFIGKSDVVINTKKVSELFEGDLLKYPYVYDGDSLKPYKNSIIQDLKPLIYNGNVKGILTYYNDLNKRVVISNRLAAGLNVNDIMLLKEKLSLDSLVELKMTTPFAPSILISYIIMLVFGDLIWFLVSM